MKGAGDMRVLRISPVTRGLGSEHCTCTTLGGTIAAQSSLICMFIIITFQQMAVKRLEKGALFPDLQKDTVHTSGGAAWLKSRRVSNKGMFNFHLGWEAAGVVQVIGGQDLT